MTPRLSASGPLRRCLARGSKTNASKVPNLHLASNSPLACRLLGTNLGQNNGIETLRLNAVVALVKWVNFETSELLNTYLTHLVNI